MISSQKNSILITKQEHTMFPSLIPTYKDKQIKKRMEGLDILRAIAILWVFAFHYPWPPNTTSSCFGVLGNTGWAGVDLFFVLSGYLIGNQIFSALQKKGHFSLKSFWYRRLLRTLPNYWFVLALYFLIPGFPEWHLPMSAPLWKFLTFTQNFDLKTGAYSNAWSLCVEEQFYLVLPFLTLWMFYKKSFRVAWIVIIALVILGIVLRAEIWLHDVKGLVLPDYAFAYFTHIYYPTYTRLDGLIFGVAIALIKNFHPTLWTRLSHRGIWFLILGLIGLGFSCYVYRDILLMLNFYPTVFMSPILNLSFAFLVIAALSPSYLYTLHIPGARIMATWAYAMYLIEKPMISLSNEALLHYGISKTNFIAILTAFFVTLLASWLLYTFIETPFLKLRDKKFLV